MAEKKRVTFKEEFKVKWENAEALIILVCLYHTGFLKMGYENRSQTYFKEQLKAIGNVKNDILRWMLSQVQIERDWQQIILEFSEELKNYLIKKEEKNNLLLIEAANNANQVKVEEKKKITGNSSKYLNRDKIVKKEGKKIKLLNKVVEKFKKNIVKEEKIDKEIVKNEKNNNENQRKEIFYRKKNKSHDLRNESFEEFKKISETDEEDNLKKKKNSSIQQNQEVNFFNLFYFLF